MKKSQRLILSLGFIGLVAVIAAFWHGHQSPKSADANIAVSPAPGIAIPVAVLPAAKSTGPAVPAPAASVPATSVPAPAGLPPVFAQFNDWAAKFASADSAARTGLLAEGETLAQARYQEMVRLIQADPELALARALPYRLRQTMPAALSAFLEKPVSGRGQFKVVRSSALPGAEEPADRFEVTVQKKLYRAYTYGRRLRQINHTGVSLHGISACDERGWPIMALSTEVFRIVDQDEARDLLAQDKVRHAAQCALCGASVAPARAVIADTGDGYSAFCSLADAKTLDAQASAAMAEVWPTGLAETKSGSPTVAPYSYNGTQGIKKLLYIPVVFGDDPVPPESQDASQAIAANNNRFYKEGSYGIVDWLTTVTPILQLPQSKNCYGEGLGPALGAPLLGDAITAARAAGYLDSYDMTYTVFPSVPQANFGGRSDGLLVGGGGALPHELGHNLGLGHANYLDYSGVRPGPRNTYPVYVDSQIGHGDLNAPYNPDKPWLEEYGDVYDVMGSGGGHFNVIFKNSMQWLNDQYIRIIRAPVEQGNGMGTVSETNRIYAFDSPMIFDGRLYALRVRKDQGKEYWLTVRQGVENNPWFEHGLEIMWSGDVGAVLVDTTPETTPGKQDAAVVVGRTLLDPAENIWITPVAEGGAGSNKWMDVVVNMGVFVGNNPPTLSLTASNLTVPVGGTVLFQANATDPDGDALAYNWDFDDFTFGTNGPVNSKTFNVAGHYAVRCEASDMKGGVARAYVVITVGSPTTFTISGRVTDPEGNPVANVRVHNGGTPPPYVAPIGEGNPPEPPPVDDSTYRYTYTDTQGYYTLTKIPAGAYNCEAFLFGYVMTQDFVTPVEVVAGNPANVNFIGTALPRVTITHRQDATEDGTVVGGFTLTRDAGFEKDLDVFFTPTGKAVAGTDYVSWPSNTWSWPYMTNVTINGNRVWVTNIAVMTALTVTIPAGFSSANLDVVATNNTVGDGGRDVTLTVQLAPWYLDTVNYLTNVVVTNTVDGTNYVRTNTIPVTWTNMYAVPGWRDQRTPPDNAVRWVQTYPTYILAGAESKVMILEDDPVGLPAVSLTALDSTIQETRGDNATLMFTRASCWITNDLVVHYTVRGADSNGVDFLPVPGVATILAGETSVVVPVVGVEDLFVEGFEMLIVTLDEDPVHYSVAGGMAFLTIEDNDLPLVSIYASDSVASKTGGNSGQVTFLRTGDLTDALQVAYLISGTAVSGRDFQPVSGSVTIQPYAATATVTITPINNTNIGAKTVVIQVSDSQSYNVYSQNAATVTILDNLPTVTLSVVSGTVTEGGGVGTFRITRTGPTTNSLNVFFTVSGTAVEGEDYATIGTNKVIPAGAASADLTVDATGSMDDKAREVGAVRGQDTVIVLLRSGLDYNVGTPNNGTVRFGDNEGDSAFPTVGFMLRNYTVREDAGMATIYVKCWANPGTDEPEQQPVMVEYRTLPGTAQPTVNYTYTSNMIRFTHYDEGSGRIVDEGSHTTTEGNIIAINVPLLNDGVVRSNLYFDVRLDYHFHYLTNIMYVTNAGVPIPLATNIVVAPTNYLLYAVSRKIRVNLTDAGVNAVSVASDQPMAYEAGTVPGRFIISRTGPTTSPLTVTYAISGSAAGGNDYVSLTTNGVLGTVTIPAGTNRVMVNVSPIDDPEEELDETVTLTVLSQPGYSGAGSATVTVVSEDGTMQFVNTSYTVSENAGFAQITVQRTGATNNEARVDYQITDGTATRPDDYLGTNGTLVFAPGERLKSFPIQIVNDSLVEPDETVQLRLVNPTGGVPLGGQNRATLTIVNDDTSLQFLTNSFSVDENAGSTEIVVTRLGLTNELVSVTFSTANGTATDALDFLGVTNRLDFNPGETSRLVHLPILDDGLFEGDETVVLLLSEVSSNAWLGTVSNASLTILDDECTISFAATNFVAIEYAPYVEITVVRVGGAVNPVSVDLSTSDGTAFTGQDYLGTNGLVYFEGNQYLPSTNGSGELEFHPGETTQFIRIPLLDDVLGEGNEFFNLAVSNPQTWATADPGATLLGSVSTSTATILDNEMPGNVDYEYGTTGAGANGPVYAVALQADGMVVFGGEFTTVDGQVYNRIARLQNIGVVDPFFNPGFGANATVYAVAVTPDNKVLLGGNFTTVDAAARQRIARVNANGELDTNFNTAVGANGTVRAIAAQADNQVVIGGDFTQVGALGRSRLARLTATGAVDTAFAPSFNNTVLAVAAQPDGRILVGGVFTSVNGTNLAFLVRLNASGTLDPTFQNGPGLNGAVSAIALQADGRILIGGAFTAVGGQPRNYVARLDGNGTLDESFNPGVGPNAQVNALAVHPNGRIMIGGDFVTYNGMARIHFARLRSNGGLDTIFNPGSGANLTVRAVAIQPDTAVIIGGDFNTVNGLPRNHIARIHGDERSNMVGVDFSQPTYTVVESEGPAHIIVQRSGNTNIAFTVTLTVSDGSASNNVDYVGFVTNLNFAAGQISMVVSIPIIDDLLIEGNETVLLSLGTASQLVDLSGLSAAVLVIEDDERAVRLASADYWVDEGATNVVITVLREGNLSGTISAWFETADGTAIAGQDYTAVSTNLVFAPGESNKTVLIRVFDDTVEEVAEAFSVGLTNFVNCFPMVPQTGHVTILDNDITYGTFNFANTNAILILDAQPAIPYPSTINVLGLTGVVSRVVVTLVGVHHTFPSDIDVLLVGPHGERMILMSDAGARYPLTGATLSFDDAVANPLPQLSQIFSGVYLPTDYESDDAFPAPAPADPYGSTLDVFNGADANGTWSLYVVDDRGSDFGIINNGWRLAITTVDPARVTDLAVGMTAAPDPVMVGQTLTYQINVTNHGPLPATGVMLTDSLPAGVTYASSTASQGGTLYTNGAVLCNLGGLDVGGTALITIEVIPQVVGLVTNRLSCAGNQPDVNRTNDRPVVVTRVIEATGADLLLGLTAAPEPVLAGQPLTYTLTVTNRGPDGATGVMLTNILPAGLGLIGTSASQGSISNLGSMVVFNLGSLAARAGAAASVTVIPSTPGLITNVAAVGGNQVDPTPDNNAVLVSTVIPAADLQLTMTGSYNASSGRITYNIVVLNNGPGLAHNVTLMDALPAQFAFLSATNSQGTVLSANGTYVLDCGSIASGGSVLVTIIAEVSAQGTFTNTALVLGAEDDPNLANNTVAVVTTVMNSGVSGTGIIDNGVIQLGVHPAGDLNVQGGQPSSGSRTTVVGLRYLPTGAEATAPGCLCEGWGVADAISRVAGGANESSDMGPFNLRVINFQADSATARSVVEVGPAEHPVFRVTHYYHPIETTSNLYLVDVTIQNISSNAVEVLYRRVMDWDVEPTAFLEYVTLIKGDSPDLYFTSDNGFASANPLSGPSSIRATNTFINDGPADHGALFDFNFGRLIPGGVKSFRTYYGAAATELGAKQAIARVGAEAYSLGKPSGPNGLALGQPNTFIFAFGGIGGSGLFGANLDVKQTASIDPVLLGSQLIYTLRVTNAGPDAATGIMLTNKLPAQVTLNSFTTSQGTITSDSNLVVASLGTLVKGGVATVLITVTPDTLNPLTNVVSVLANEDDPNLANNSATNLTQVVATGTFANSTSIAILDAGPSVPYPSIIHVSGLTGVVSMIRVALVDLSHSFVSDVGALVVGPQGQTVVLMSDAGRGAAVSHVGLQFEDAAGSLLPALGPILSGTYRPTSLDPSLVFFAPAPLPPYGTSLQAFNGADPNGDWKLFLMDDQGQDSGVLAGGWRLTIATVEPQPVLAARRVGSNIVLSWPSSMTGFVLESRGSMSPLEVWVPAPEPQSVVGGMITVTVDASSGERFFRLHKP